MRRMIAVVLVAFLVTLVPASALVSSAAPVSAVDAGWKGYIFVYFSPVAGNDKGNTGAWSSPYKTRHRAEIKASDLVARNIRQASDAIGIYLIEIDADGDGVGRGIYCEGGGFWMADGGGTHLELTMSCG